MPLMLSTQTINTIRSTRPLPQIAIKLLEQDEPHAVAKLLCCDLVEFYLFCEKLRISASTFGRHLFAIRYKNLNSSLFN